MTTHTDALGFSLVSRNTIDALEEYASLHVEDFRGLKEDFLTWLAKEGKRPIKGIGYEENTVRATHYKIEAMYRWLWSETGMYETDISPEDANAFCNHVMKEQTDEVTADYVKALKRYFEWQNAHSDREIEWEYENWDELNLNAHKKSIDYFRRVAVGATAVKSNSGRSWVYAAIDVDTKLLLDVALFGRRGTDPAAAFLHGLAEKHGLGEVVFLIDGFGYLAALVRLELSGQLDYVERNLIEKWFHTLKMRIDCFHTS